MICLIASYKSALNTVVFLYVEQKEWLTRELFFPT